MQYIECHANVYAIFRVFSEMWVVPGVGGEELDKGVYADGSQRCITADTKWTQVQVLSLIVQLH